MLRRTAVALLLCALVVPLYVLSRAQASAPVTPALRLQQIPAQPTPTPDPNDPIERIKNEALNHSQVMETLSYLSDVIGPRLTASPNMKRACEWTRDRLGNWGLQNAHLEPWGPFGRGWTLKRFSAEVVEPQAFPVIAYPKAWSPGTGQITANVIYVDAKDEAELRAKYTGELKGAIVLTGPMREVKARFEPQGTRRDEKNLLELADAPDPAARPPLRFPQLTADQRAAADLAYKKLLFYQNEGAALLIDPGRGDDGTVFVQQATVPTAPDTPRERRVSAWQKDAPKILPQVVMAAEHYNRVVRMLQAGERVRMAINLDVQFQDQDLMGYNTVAEIPGTDPQLKDEIVMLGGHMDS
ncbi:MAG TPA: hypothetical protein VE821_16185, partial [Pyrinomonadaceae bacterium]|nr:hypothetical protein [Pyrinomonadaceae bacterium]